jgi:hypothetical protein
MRQLRMLFALTLVGAACAILPAFANAASGTLHPFIPGGLPTNNVGAAWNMIQSRAAADPSFAAALASNAGDSIYSSANFKPLGYHNGAPGTVNSGATDEGTVSKSQDTKECSTTSKMVVLLNVHTQTKVYVCTACSNPRIYSVHPAPFHPFSKGTVVRYNRTFSKLVLYTCASGQKVSVMVTTWIHGKLYARTWGQANGTINARLSASFQANANQTITLKCGAPPKKPVPCGCAAPAPPAPQPPVVVVVVVTPTCVGANACSNNPPPPSNVTVTGLTTVQSLKTLNLACPAPNQGIVKTGTGAVGLTSPTFTGSGTSQSAAQADLASQESTWQTQNQGVADAAALQQAQSNLNTALQSCPSAPPSPTAVISVESINDIPAGQCRPVTITTNFSAPGSLIIDPGVGSVNTDCYDSSTRQSTLTIPVSAGNGSFVVNIWVPSDASVTTQTLTVTATISGMSPPVVSSQTFAVSQPVRP